MTNKTKLIDLIKSGNLNLAIELSKGVELDIVELLVAAMDSLVPNYLGLRECGGYHIRYADCNGYTKTYWFCPKERRKCIKKYNYTYTDFETPELLAEAILNYHKQINDND